MKRGISVSYWLALLVLLVVPSVRGAANGQEPPQARANRFYNTVASGEYSATWEMLSASLTQETSKEEYTKELAEFFTGSKFSFQVGQARERAPQRVEVISDLSLTKENTVYPIRHTTIWVFDKARNNWFFDGEYGRPQVTQSPR